MMTQQIDPYEAMKLRRLGMTWRRIGIELARRHGRELPYQANSICHAVIKYERENTK